MGDLIGVQKAVTLDRENQPVLAERIVETASPYLGSFFQHKPLGGHREGHLEVHPNAEVLTVLCGREGSEYELGEFTFKNYLGGRILGIPLFLSIFGHNPFLNHYRIESLQRWIRAVIDGARETFSLVEGNPNVLLIHVKYGDRERVLCLNLCTQSMMDVKIRCYNTSIPTKAFLWEEVRVKPLDFSIERDGSGFVIRTTSEFRPLSACIFLS